MSLLKFRIALLLFTALFAISPNGLAKVFYSKEEAMQLAFGNEATVEMLSLFPSADEAAKIEQLAKTKLESNLFSFYVGKKQNTVLGYAAIETHTVRTKPETLLIVLNADGSLRQVITLAFHEPPEYQPPERWFEQLKNHAVTELDFGQDIQGITGATLTTRAALASTRKVLAIYQIMLQGK